MLFQYLKSIEELFQCGTLALIFMEFKNCIVLSVPQNLKPKLNLTVNWSSEKDTQQI